MAKVKMLGNSKPTGNKYPMLNGAIRDDLHGLTINEALAAGYITDIGDDKGGFIFDAADENIDASYGIINGKRVQLSKNLVDALDDCANVQESDELLGKCQFWKGMSQVKIKNGEVSADPDAVHVEVFRLTMPAGVELKATARVRIGVEPVEA